MFAFAFHVERIGKQNKKRKKMKTIYIADRCLSPFRLHQYSKHFEIFVYEDLKKNRKYFYDFSKLLDLLEFKKKHKIECERFAFNDGSRAFHFYVQGCLITHARTKSLLPKCRISLDRSKLELEITEIELFNI